VAAVLLAAIRLVLGLAALLLAIARGVDATVALATAGFGAVLCGFAIVSMRPRPQRRAPDPSEPAWRIALRATYPSTIFLTGLSILSLVIRPQLAALCAGLLAALAFAALAFAAQVEWTRRTSTES
jgi:hypothetical protein